MIKRILLILLLVVGLAGGVLSPVPVMAAGGPSVLSSSVVADFPASLTFNIAAESDETITDIRLHYQVEHLGFAQVTSEVVVAFAPAKSVEGQWVWDMRQTGSLPPGATVEYWWTVTDAGGAEAETAAASIIFEDTRYDWHRLTGGMVTLSWYDGDDAFAGKLMAVTQQALAGLLADTGAALEKPVKIYIYADSSDLQGSMIYSQEWTGGVTFAAYGIIAIGIGPGDLDWGSRAITHELTHLVIGQAVFNPYGGLPTWLNEGLAMHAEGPMEDVFAATLESAAASGGLVSVRSLSSPFSAYSSLAVLDYAESASIVTFLIDTYGQEKMSALLTTFAGGSGYDEALKTVYGFDMDGLDKLWRAGLGAATTSPATTGAPSATSPVVGGEAASPWLIGLLAGLSAALLLVLVLLARGWARRRR